MARETFSASILESNLESLKNKTTEVADQFKALTGSAEKFGVSFSQSVRSATSNLQGLQSALSNLESSLRKVSGTGSVVGAANISGALGQLTGQGGGGGGAYRRGGGGGASRYPDAINIGGLVDALTPKWMEKIGKIPGLGMLGKVAKVTAGMAVQSMRNSRDAHLRWEQEGYLSRFVGTGTTGQSRFRKFGNIGMDPFQARGVYDSVASMFGGTDDYEDLIATRIPGYRKRRTKKQRRSGQKGTWVKAKTVYDDPLLNFKKLLTGMGIDEGAISGLGGAIMAGTGGTGAFSDTRSQLYQIYAQSKSRMEGLGLTNPRSRQASLDRTNAILTAGLGAFYQQQVGISALGRQTLGKAPGFLGALAGAGGGGFKPEVATQLLQQLRKGTLAPGGGQAGEVFALQAAGFGNPYLRREQAMAEKLGVTDANLQRRDYLAARKFRQDNPIEMILNQMIGVATKFAGQNNEVKGFALSQLTGIGQSRSEKLMEMLMQGRFTQENLRQRIQDIKGADDPAKKLGGVDRAFTGRGGRGFITNLARLNRALLRSRQPVLNFTKAITSAQIALLKFANKITKALDIALKEDPEDQGPPPPGKKKK